MSGGAFEYKQYHIKQIAEDIQSELNKQGREKSKEELYMMGDYYEKYPEERFEVTYPKEIQDRMNEAVKALEIAHIYAQRVDWYLSGDDGDESFLRRLKEELNQKKKMKATELRINNWVQFKHTETPVIITLGDFVREYKDEHLDDYEPIPLTEEWLKRLGFEIKKGAWGTSAEIRIGRARYVLYQNRNVWSINPTDGFRVDFKYIHTVQNHYFALTGQELNQNKDDNSTDNFNNNSIPSV